MSELEKKEQELTQSQRFTNAVIREFKSTTAGAEVNEFQKKLCNNYFVKLNQTLSLAEIKRLAKREQDRDPLEVTWANIDMTKLAIDVMSFCKVGLDPTLPNQLSLLPFKNKNTNKYDIVFMIGYKGCELKAKKYGFEIPTDVVIEVVYSTDKFRQIKRDHKNAIEGYEFEVKNDFNRGEIIGGFYYHKFANNPEKNRIRVFNMKDILKRKPKYASTEFWGGEVAVKSWDKKANKYVETGEVEHVEGWLDEMVYKTLYRAAYDAITIDSQKIDEALVNVMEKDKEAMFGNMNDRATEEANYEDLTDKKPEPQQPKVIGFEKANAVVKTEAKPDPVEKVEEVKEGPQPPEAQEPVKAPF